MKKRNKKVKQSWKQRLKKASRFMIGNADQKREIGKTKFLFLFVFALYICYILLTYVL